MSGGIIWNGEIRSVPSLAAEFNISAPALHRRLARMTVAEALAMPYTPRPPSPIKQAKRERKNKYTGATCSKHGHGVRYTSSRNCIDCTAENKQKSMMR